MFSNVFKCFQMFSNVFKCFQMFSNVFKWCQLCPNGLNGFQTSQRFGTVWNRIQPQSTTLKSIHGTQNHPSVPKNTQMQPICLQNVQKYQNAHKLHPIHIQKTVHRLKWMPTCPYNTLAHLPFPILYLLCLFGHVRSCAARNGTARNSMTNQLNFGRKFRRATRHWQSSLQSLRNPWASRWCQILSKL